MSKHDFLFFFCPAPLHRAPLHIVVYKCITFYQCVNFPSGLQSWCRGSEVWRLEHDCETNNYVATLQRRSVPCKISHLTEDDGKIHVNTGMVELHDTLEVEKKKKAKLSFLFFVSCSTNNANHSSPPVE